MKNKLNEMSITSLSDQEVTKLSSFEEDFNKTHNGEEIYVLVLNK